MTNEELYNYLLNHKNITLSVRWYDGFGSIDFTEFSKSKKFQKAHISKVDADAAYDVAFNNMSFVYLLDEDWEELVKEAYQIHKEYFRNRGWNVEKYFPAIQSVLLKIDEIKIGETFFIKE